MSILTSHPGLLPSASVPWFAGRCTWAAALWLGPSDREGSLLCDMVCTVLQMSDISTKCSFCKTRIVLFINDDVNLKSVNKNSTSKQYKHWCCFNLKQNLSLETLYWNSLQFCEIEEYSVQFLSTIISQFIYNPFLWHALPVFINRMHSTRLNKIYSAIHCKTFGNKCPWKWTLKRMPCITEDVAWLA